MWTARVLRSRSLLYKLLRLSVLLLLASLLLRQGVPRAAVVVIDHPARCLLLMHGAG